MNGSRAILKITYRCNSACRFCRASPFRELPDPPAEVLVRKMMAAKALGVDTILFSGGEPTLRPDLPRLAAAAGSLGLGFGLITNARRLAEPAALRSLLALGLSYVHTSLLGSTAGTHDGLARAEAFGQVIAALDGLAGKGIELVVNTVIMQGNLGELVAITDRIARYTPVLHKLSLAEPLGWAASAGPDLLPDPGDAARAALAACARRPDVPGFSMAIEGFPFCQIPESMSAGLSSLGILYLSEGHEHVLYPTDSGTRVFPPECDQCHDRGRCPGIYPGYALECGGEPPL
jgi:pyruvate-formate lyase-activating enzyme